MHLPPVSVAPAVTRGPLTLFPLTVDLGTEVTPGDYLPGPVALADALVEVGEKDDGAVVAELVVVNRAAVPVLLIEGEALVGAKQNRVLNVSVLLAAHASTTIPVSCVERGRWGGEQRTRRSARHAPGQLRKHKTMSVNRSARMTGGKESDQGQVWREVDSYLAALTVQSPSSALEDVYEDRSDDLHSVVDGLAPVAGQVGMVVAHGAQIRSLDLFDRPATLAAYWDALISGAALDALCSPRGKAPNKTAATRFLRQLRVADAERGDSTGLGTDLRVDTDALTATGLEWDGVTRHVAAFAVEPGDRPPARVDGTRRTTPPIRRSRPHRD